MGVFECLTGGWGSLLGAGLDFIGGERANDAAADMSREAREWNAEQFAKRYQIQTEDMKKAGLNPMLSYSQQPTGQPQAVAAPVQNTLSGAGDKVAQLSVVNNTAENIRAQTEKIKAETNLLEHFDPELKNSQSQLNYSSAEQAKQAAYVAAETVSKIKQETANLRTEQDKIRVAIQELAASRDLLIQKGYTERQATEHTRYMAEKAEYEAGLTFNEYLSDVRMESIGRDASKLKPVIDIIRSMMKGK